MSVNTATWEFVGQVNLNDAPTTVNPFGPSPQVVDVAFCVRRAAEQKASHKACADAVGSAPDYWNRILSNERGIKLAQLGQLPVDVQREIVRGWAGVLGLQIERKGDAIKRVAVAKLAEAAQALAECL